MTRVVQLSDILLAVTLIRWIGFIDKTQTLNFVIVAPYHSSQQRETESNVLITKFLNQHFAFESLFFFSQNLIHNEESMSQA